MQGERMDPQMNRSHEIGPHVLRMFLEVSVTNRAVHRFVAYLYSARKGSYVALMVLVWEEMQLTDENLKI